MPNAQIQPDMPLAAFAVPLDMLESVAGAPLLHTCLSYCVFQASWFLDLMAF